MVPAERDRKPNGMPHVSMRVALGISGIRNESELEVGALVTYYSTALFVLCSGELIVLACFCVDGLHVHPVAPPCPLARCMGIH